MIETIGKWYVLRHSSRRGDPWRLVIATDNPQQADRVYERKVKSIRYGAVRLYNPDGQVLRALRTGGY